MKSKIAELIRLKNHPVAILKSDVIPVGAAQFKEGKRGCVIALLSTASRGRTAVSTRNTTVCRGGKVGLGFQPFPLGEIEYFLSVGQEGGRAGEFYKESPEYGRSYCTSVPEITAKESIIYKPLELVSESESPDAVIFLVNADQLSALATLANYDRPTQDNVQLLFGAGCAQSILYPLKAQEDGKDCCYIGLTDPSARKCIHKDLLSFGIPYHRFLEMERKAESSFLTKETWEQLSKRIAPSFIL